MEENILFMENITKIYSNGIVANNKINFECKKGEIHSLLGENGAGKTTLMKILFGIERLDEGRIILHGKDVTFHSPLDAIKNGIGMVHQHFKLVDELSVAENVVLGEEPGNNLFFNSEMANEITCNLAKKYKFKIDPKSRVSECSVGGKQQIEILKALLRGAEILILDEPTSVLTPQETIDLFHELRTLRDHGHSIIFISHKLEEVKKLCDRFTILRHGKNVIKGVTKNFNRQQLANNMVGRAVSLKIKKEKTKSGGREVVRIENLSYSSYEGKILLDNLSFSMYEGQILGVAGVEGNGQNELCEIITGFRKVKRGNILINGKLINKCSIREIRNFGVASISEDRMTYGCAPQMSIRDNIIADRYFKSKFSHGFQLNTLKIKKEVDKYIHQFSIDCPSQNSPIGMLSGGNMQKVIIAREFTNDANVIIANQPTRGIDVGSTEFIIDHILKLTREKLVSVLFVSADLSEVMQVSDKLMVMYKGAITAFFNNLQGISEFQIGEFMLGTRKMSDDELRRTIYEASKSFY